MKQLFAIITVTAILFSCNDKSGKPSEATNEKEILIFYPKNDSIREAIIATRAVTKTVGYDSITKKDFVKVHTIYASKRMGPLIDSVTQKPKLDSLGNQLLTQYGWNKLNDSLVVVVSEIPYDSLVRIKH